MIRKTMIVVAAMAAFAGPAVAQPEVQTNVSRTPDQTTVTGVAKVTATITAIDAASRKVTLKTKAGKVRDLVVGEDVRNFDQLKVGDIVTIEYKEALTVSLKKGSGPPSMQERESADRAAPGAKPGGTVGREVTVVADVVAVNKEAQIVTVKGPKGRVLDLMVEDPEQMKNVKKGDRVQAVYTEALAVSVQPGPAK
ncbi:hypothetical protein SAMN05216345_11541 [Cupriavidus sp. YR651]|uniref:hypothetical protein n=1 Tax=Cupriavidus sp. YR651 TaxID=1855315 RepID=UPI000887C6A5|nr:hypothetical protein [Cupriavidus sp. YR651]SDD75739.1 hypothetical protein SAMN05216345_11541 [Cupriavidus sp. YR651]